MARLIALCLVLMPVSLAVVSCTGGQATPAPMPDIPATVQAHLRDIPTQTPYPTPLPRAPLPTHTPAPTYTPYPTPEQLPTYTPYPTHTPYPTYTPEPTPTPQPTFAPPGPPEPESPADSRPGDSGSSWLRSSDPQDTIYGTLGTQWLDGLIVDIWFLGVTCNSESELSVFLTSTLHLMYTDAYQADFHNVGLLLKVDGETTESTWEYNPPDKTGGTSLDAFSALHPELVVGMLAGARDLVVWVPTQSDAYVLRFDLSGFPDQISCWESESSV